MNHKNGICIEDIFSLKWGWPSSILLESGREEKRRLSFLISPKIIKERRGKTFL